MKSFGLFIFTFLFSLSGISQPGIIHEYGKPSQSEIDMEVYELDPKAKAVVLFERGDYRFSVVESQVVIVKKVYRKIKILSEDAKDYGVGSIILYGNPKNYEWISQIKAVTTNGHTSTFLSKDEIYYKPYGINQRVATFAFPNVQKGSILEYQYTHVSPFLFNLDGWVFQNKIPTLYSEFKAEIPGFYIYNRSLIGERTLDVNTAEIKEGCFNPLPGYSANCEILKYAMSNIPAFEEEEFMLSKKNYLSRLNFQLEQSTNQRGVVSYYTKNWETVDKEFRKDKNIGVQTRRNNFLKRQLPKESINISEPLPKAKAIYSFIQNHFKWNKKNKIFQESNVKEAFINKTGSASEINLALINAFQAAGLDSEIALLSTRDNGLPIKKYAVITDFNYLIAYLNINGEKYFLDATDKNTPFGILPFKCLNYSTRVMDFKKGSYWEIIKPFPNNVNNVSVQLKIDENYNLSGIIRESNIGYRALEKRSELDNQNLENYLQKKENEYGNIDIKSYEVSNRFNLEKPIYEDFEIYYNKEINQTLILDPFLKKSFKTNPFVLNDRKYPVDFGFPYKYVYNFSFDLADKFDLLELPKNQSFKIPGNRGEMSVFFSDNNGIIQMRYYLYLYDYHFEHDSYKGLKAFFDMVVEIQNNSLILLKKN